MPNGLRSSLFTITINSNKILNKKDLEKFLEFNKWFFEKRGYKNFIYDKQHKEGKLYNVQPLNRSIILEDDVSWVHEIGPILSRDHSHGKITIVYDDKYFVHLHTQTIREVLIEWLGFNCHIDIRGMNDNSKNFELYMIKNKN